MPTVQTRPVENTSATTMPVPARVIELELGQPLPIIAAFDERTQHSYSRAICLVRLHSAPLGIIQLALDEDGTHPQDYAPLIWQSLQRVILQHLQQDGLPAITGLGSEGIFFSVTPACIEERENFLRSPMAPFISVVVPTRDRPDSLASCISSLASLAYPHYEIVIVDNAPTTSATAELVQQLASSHPQLRYVREDQPGISSARNRGMVEAQGAILAFTDDDVVVDKHWLTRFAQTFASSEEIACVTGYTLPRELQTPAQLWFEDASWITEDGGSNATFTPRLFDKRTGYQHLYRGSLYGHGANMAVRTDFLRSIGGFDLSLGTGTPTKGGEDLALFLHVVMHNKCLAYEPTALVHHLHRRDYADLRKQMYGYGVGFTAYIVHALRRYPGLCLALLTKVPYELLALALKPKTQKTQVVSAQTGAEAKIKGIKKSTLYPKDLTTTQIKGFLYGPFAYIQSCRVKRRAISKISS